MGVVVNLLGSQRGRLFYADVTFWSKFIGSRSMEHDILISTLWCDLDVISHVTCIFHRSLTLGEE